MRIAIILLVLVHFQGICQEDTTSCRKYMCVDHLPIQELSSVQVSIQESVIWMETHRFSMLRKEDIEAMQANDIGEILQKIEGVNLKSYGGLGGLKTISVRSLGSQHSVIAVDGFSVQNSQTGQVNLAQLQTNNVESIGVGIGEQIGYLNPVSNQISGNAVFIQTFEMSPMPYSDSLQIRASTRVGSFGQISSYGAAKVKMKNTFVSGFGNYRQSNGLYPYQLHNGFQEIASIRSNNDYQDHYFGGVVGYTFKKEQLLRINYKQSYVDQGLPGAVIFYANSADERLTTGDRTLNADFRFKFSESFKARAYINANSNEMRYVDPTYFNAAGKIDVTYFNRNISGGLVGHGTIFNNGMHTYRTDLFYGLEASLSDLTCSDTNFSAPIRQQVSGIFGVNQTFRTFQFRGHVSSQFVNEANRSGEDGKNVFGLNPFLSLETREFGRSFSRIRGWYLNSLRVPSFNELYYNNIGNTNLDPERANQFGINFTTYPYQRKKHRVFLTAAGYFNRITDKIVAIPTNNLFVWSIQNVGIVHAYGGEINLNSRFSLSRYQKLFLLGSMNYSFQRSIDMSDPNHPTYRHQIAYIPMHTGNADLAIEFEKIGGKVSNYLVSKRYSLNENNEANELAGFVTTDFSVFYKFQFNKKQSLRLQFQVKNAFNSSYAYIRSFVMPGRNYLISINYAFN